jgi:transcription initiation factor TFIIIB Brf1 subunit/transcription initiation factor TFIIB
MSKLDPCKECRFDDEYITDYDNQGNEYIFCGNCGTVKEGLVSDPMEHTTETKSKA